jgi:hypothetical protein
VATADSRDPRRRAALRLRGAAVLPHHVRHQDAEQEQHVPHRPEPPGPRGAGRQRRDRSFGRHGDGRQAGGLDHLDRRDEAVASAGQRLHEQRVARVVTQDLADLPHALVQPLVHLHRPVAPQSGLQLLAREQLAGAFDQQCEQPQRLRL